MTALQWLILSVALMFILQCVMTIWIIRLTVRVKWLEKFWHIL